MSLLGWTAFHAAHGRPFIIFADLAPPTRRQTRFALLARLADVLNLRGDYALLPEGRLIRLVFELEPDARVFSEAVQARKTAREGGWVGQWWFHIDPEVEAAIKFALPAQPRRRPGVSTKKGRAVGPRRAPSA